MTDHWLDALKADLDAQGLVVVEKKRWDLLEAIAKAGSEIEDILEVPDLLGHTSQEIISAAINDFRDALAALQKEA